MIWKEQLAANNGSFDLQRNQHQPHTCVGGVMFELLEAATNFAGMMVSMDYTLFKFNQSSYRITFLQQHYTENLYKSVRWGGFRLETMPKWEDTPLGSVVE